ncbi:MAG: hypothetical protein H6619_03760 [Deltaproteobacteria bacterium]|nr:hypothetical protein [Deltaproteobacteria bacterium]
MKRIFQFLILALPLTVFAKDGAIQNTMLEVYASFKDLQPYLIDSSRFEDAQNQKKIKKLVSKLSAELHGAESFDTKYRKLPGFNAQMTSLAEMLDEVNKGFETNSAGWSLWRLRAISNNCQTCHTGYGVDVRFTDKNVNLDKLDSLSKGEFYLASRQYPSAQAAFFQAAINPPTGHSSLEALRKWLIIYTRVNNDPQQALFKLDFILQKKTNLRPYEREEISDWVIALRRWSTEKDEEKDTLSKAESLLRKALDVQMPYFGKVGAVELLRSTALLHEVLDDTKLSDEKRRRALYLIGLSYSKLPLFFVNELPELFLEQCIREYPNTLEAKNSFKLIKEILITGYTGSSGAHIPGEVDVKLEELYKVAYGEQELKDQV